MSWKATRIFSIVLLCTWATTVFASQPFELDGVVVPAGEQKSFMLPAPGMGIPVTVINGNQPGPVLTLTAGVHGDEFPSILALQSLRTRIDAAELKGTLVLVHLANLPGFHARRIALHPEDDKNLNREFPGAADGTATEQLAFYLTRQVIPKTDYLIDLHSGSAYQALHHHVYSPVLYQEPLDEKTLAFAEATGMQHIVLYDKRPKDLANTISYPNTAQVRGKPALTVEVGHSGLRDDAFVEEIIAICTNALKHLGMLAGKPKTKAIIYSHLESIASPASGIFTPVAAIGQPVQPGDLLGTVSNYYGEPVAEIKATEAGTILMLRQWPAIAEGESPATLGIEK
ncbi:succinylglutamate desuccinylase/aspartoacylase family protein [Halioxenophilus aromaticivorans]|uniref:Succinylglutamate desuccinylase/aspartoacylase family protein n=1 Tax=Halioxenophilus aromaticivorans TaxID=1306992 RepID=A0AAV3U4A6_9ALTE